MALSRTSISNNIAHNCIFSIWDGGKWEPEGVYICFGSYDGGKRCERFDGTESVYSSTARKSHRNGSMCIYDGKLLAIGATNDDAYYTEMFSWEWNPAIPHPEGHSYAPCVTVDEGVLLFSKRIGTIMFGLFYILPVYYPSSSSSLYKVARTTVRSGSSQTSSGMKSETSRSKPLGLLPSLSTIIRL